MNNKVTFHEVAAKIATQTGISEESASNFIKVLFDTISDSLLNGEPVTVKGLGRFAVVDKDGETTVEFVADNEFAEAVNSPFAIFESVNLTEDISDEALSNVDLSENLDNVIEQEVELPSEDVTISSDFTVTETADLTADDEAEITEDAEIPEVADLPKEEEGVGLEANTEETQPEATEEIESPVEPMDVIITDSTITEESESSISEASESTISEASYAEKAEAEEPAKSEEPAEDLVADSDAIEESKPETPLMSLKSAINLTPLEEDTEEYVARPAVQPTKSRLGLGIFIGLLIGLAIGACGVYFAINYLFPDIKANDAQIEEINTASEEDEATLPLTEPLEDEINDSIPEIAETPEASQLDQVSEEVKAVTTPTEVLDTVRAGYYLQQMAKKHYGSKEFWGYIYEENTAKIKNPNNLHAGLVVVIPPAEKYGINSNSNESLKKAREVSGKVLAKFPN